jgi:hypothetical protein
VTRLYQNVLGRSPDTAGFNFWKGQLDTNAMTRGQVMLYFSESAEYRPLVSNEVFVTMSYVGMLRRSPDPNGFSFWVNYLDSGNPPTALLQGFIDAPEYHARFLP